MYQNKTVSTYCRKLIIAALAMISLLLSNTSLANHGINAGTTLVLGQNQYPAAIKKFDPSEVYILYWGITFGARELQGSVLRGDTIINYKKFTESFPNGTGFRLIYKSKENIDSVLQLDSKLRVTDKAYNLGSGMLHMLAFDSTQKKLDEFIYNYDEKLSVTSNTRGGGGTTRTLEWILRQYIMYSTYDRNNYAKGAVWILSIGIDNYEGINFTTCKTDARSYTDFFRAQFGEGRLAETFFHEYVLLDKDATRTAILAALKDIASKSSLNDYFIFNFSGFSNVSADTVNEGTIFFPYDVALADRGKELIKNRFPGDTTSPLSKCIPLKILQEYFQSIPAINQLFISEAGPSEKFKTEFIKTLMQNSPEAASILNKNRVIIVPNGFGYDNVTCNGEAIQKGPINYYITSFKPLKTTDLKDKSARLNIFDLFNEEKASKVAFIIKNKAYTCESFKFDYFDIFFERKFLKEYKEVFGNGAGQTRGLGGLKTKELRSAANFSGKQYALVVGTDNYKGAGWKKLPNAINDARAVADMLAQGYGFEVQLMEDKPMDSIYKAIGEYYRNLQPNDQFILYFAGHGDMENEFMDDGFIVCTDSRSRADDPTRNTYIQYVKLQKMINRIPARQILVMLDVCHGGTFNQKRNDPGATITNRNVRQFLVDQSQYVCRKFLSSVGTEEAFDGKPGDHSPFANLLLQVLNAKGKETNGIVTLSEIFFVLQKSSNIETASLKISPQKDGFGSDNPQSDFILIPVEKEIVKQ
jgi:hypothetical protein